jgi:acetyltransferase
MDSLKSFLEPKSVAVIGASREPDKLGYGVARNMTGSGFPGEIFLVNPKGGELFDRPLLPDVAALPEGVDLALVVVAAQYVPETLLAGSRKGIKHYIILTGGFSEAGPEGAALEARCREIAAAEGLRVIGPNCIGVLDTHVPLDTTFIQPPIPAPGEVAFISHSGALGAAMIDWAKQAGFGFSTVVSLGNQMDVTESDVLAALADKVTSKVITMYLEGLKDGQKFIRNASAAAAKKPVIALKVGRSEAGQKAAASHTGALAGANQAFEAAFRKAGILPARTTEEMFQWARMFAQAPLPKGNRLAILTNAGGPGVTAADAITGTGLAMAEWSAETRERLAGLLPAAASMNNPVDMLASASPEVYAACLEALLTDEGVDLALVIAPPPPMFRAEDIAAALADVIRKSEKPVAVAMMGSDLVAEGVRQLRADGIPDYAFPEEAVSCLGALWRYTEMRNKADQRLPIPLAEQRPETSRLQGDGGFADPVEVFDLLAAYGLPVAPLRRAKDESSAVQAAGAAGYPVAMKLDVSGVSHKSDLGGVLLGLVNAEEAQIAYRQIYARAAAKLTGTQMEGFGVQVQKMAPKGQEVIIGAVRDPVFGPLLMFGSGGTEVEGAGDVAFALAPLSEDDLDHLLTSTWAGRKLRGFRQHRTADMEAVRQALLNLSAVMAAHPEIAEVEINPMIVLEAGQGAVVVDARVVLAN